MEKLVDSTQLVSGVAILLSFIAGYKYGLRNVDETQSKAKNKGGETFEPRVIKKTLRNENVCGEIN